MKRLIFSVVLFASIVLTLIGCSSLFDGSGSEFGFGMYVAWITVIPTSDSDIFEVSVCFYDPYESDHYHPYGGIDTATCNGIDLEEDSYGVFSGRVTPVEDENFLFNATKDDNNAGFGVRLRKPQLLGVSEGDQVETNDDYTIFYASADGESIQAWCEDDNGGSETAGEQNDDGSYSYLDTSGLSGPGVIWISRNYEEHILDSDGTLLGAYLGEGTIFNVVNVVWVSNP